MNQTAAFILRSPSHALEGAGLHDATLRSVTIEWSEAQAVVHLLLVGGVAAILVFHKLTSAIVTREQPWGPSTSINGAATLREGEYEIEIQSGDKLVFQAASWSLSIAASPSEA